MTPITNMIIAFNAIINIINAPAKGIVSSSDSNSRLKMSPTQTLNI